jgi:uncharacterized protein (TIGR03437 family)
MRTRFFAIFGFLSIFPSWGQIPTAPVVPPRGVVNAFSLQPAPSTLAPGGILYVQGLNLGPAAGWKAEGLPLPTRFGEPATEVLINNRPAPLFEATPSRITAQVPYETPNGLVTLVVRRGTQQSRPVRFQVNALAPALLSANGLGYGGAADSGSASTLKLRASSLGLLTPALPNGEAAPEDSSAQPRQNIYALLGGLPAAATVRASRSVPGEFDIEVSVPEGAQPGEALLLVAGNANANPLTWQGPKKMADLLYLPLPSGVSDIRSLRSSDTRATYIVANGPRSAEGCYPSYVFDLAAAKVRPVEGCLTASARQAVTPFSNGLNGPTFAAFEGPFAGNVAGQAVLPVSDRVRVFQPLTESEILAKLPAPASTIGNGEAGDFTAVIAAEAGQPAKVLRIDSLSGAVEEAPAGGAGGAGAGGGGAGPGGAGGIAGANLLQRFTTIDLGDGINKLLSAPTALVNQILIVAGDSLDAPAKARLAVLNNQGDIVAQRNFPEGWLPLAAPGNPQAVAPPGGGALPPGAGNALRFPTPIYADPGTRNTYVPARNSQGQHALVLFPANGESSPIALPEGWVFTSCTANLPVFVINLANQIALAGSKNEDRDFKNPCPSDGFVTLDLASRQLRAVPLPGAGQLNLSAATVDINDYLLGTNTDPARRNTSDTIYVFDGVNASAYRLDLPAGVSNFSGLNPQPNLNLAIAQANNRAVGDAGIVLFDLERSESRLLPTPEGFSNIQFLGIYPAIRKLAARGILANNAGAQILVYDLDNGDLQILPNPDGNAWFGTPIQAAAPGQPGGGGQGGGPGQAQVNLPIRANLKAHSVDGMIYDSARQAKGIAVVRIY